MKELLSADELNNLLTAVSDGDVPSAVGSAPAGDREVRDYDFRAPARLTREQLGLIERLHDEAGSRLSAVLGDLAHTPVEAVVSTVEPISYGTFNSTLPVPICLQVFRIEGPQPAPEAGPGRRARGRAEAQRGLLTLDVALALSLVDRILGGQGQSIGQPRPLTAIEKAILARPLAALLAELAAAWSSAAPIRFEPEAIETDPKLVPILPARESALQVSFAIGGEIIVGDVTLCLPMALVERLIPRGKPGHAALRQPGDEADAGPSEALERALAAAPVRVALELGRSHISVLDLLNLQPGHVVRLGTHIGQPLTVTVEGTPRLTARPGLVGKRLGFQVAHVPPDPSKESKR